MLARFIVMLFLGMCVAIVPAIAAEPDTAEAKIVVLTELSRQNRENRQKLRTWEGTLAYRMAFRIPPLVNVDRKATRDPDSEFVRGRGEAEQVDRCRTGRVTFRRAVEPDRLAEELKDDGPIVFVRSPSGTKFSESRTVYEERIVALPDELLSFQANRYYTVEGGDQRLKSVFAVRHSPRTRERYLPVWPLDTNPWTGEFIDPMSFFGHDRPTEDYLDRYLASLCGDLGPEDAAQVDRAVKLTSRVVDNEMLLTLEGDLLGRVDRLEFRERTGQLVAQRRWLKEPGKTPWIDFELTWEYETSGDLWTPKKIVNLQHSPRGAGVSTRIEYEMLASKVNSPLPEDSFTESFLRAPGDAWRVTSDEKGIQVVRPESPTTP
jgi:hypothetical protein